VSQENKKMNSISQSEQVLMEILWRDSPLTAADVVKRVDPKYDWQEKTVKTLLNRLLKKCAIGFEKSGRQYLYYPLIEQGDFVQSETQSFLQRMFQGSLPNMVSNFAQQEQISDDELEALKAIIKKMERGDD
jgi:BlaI family transcriptional regulator, penicillinase repressor